ncbi:MAG TPA: replication initiator, partial [Micromonosporaceae bacterium]|nr:replication initiator [Micromonosporaceae bacterium]
QRYPVNTPPRWDPDHAAWVDPDTGQPLTTWDTALDQLDADPDAAPAHVVRFGDQVHAQGVLAGSTDAERCVRYITKYLAKHAADCHDTSSVRQQAHLDRLWQQLRITPCTDRCANWLLYGIQPRKAHRKLAPGRCKGRVHQRATLGLGGRRVLVSRQWSGKTLADHRADNRAWVRQLLGLTVDLDQAATDGGSGPASRYAWELAPPTDPDVPPLAHRLLRAISERLQHRSQLDQARRQATGEVAQGGG